MKRELETIKMKNGTVYIRIKPVKKKKNVNNQQYKNNKARERDNPKGAGGDDRDILSIIEQAGESQ
jgi:hypothetical protein